MTITSTSGHPCLLRPRVRAEDLDHREILLLLQPDAHAQITATTTTNHQTTSLTNGSSAYATSRQIRKMSPATTWNQNLPRLLVLLNARIGGQEQLLLFQTSKATLR